MKTTTKVVLLAAAVTAFSLTIYKGLEVKTDKLLHCNMFVYSSMVANYSELVAKPETGIDANGNVYTYTDLHTEYWSEQISEQYEAVTRDGNLIKTDSGKHFKDGYYVPDMPDPFYYHKKNLDSVSEKIDTQGTAQFENDTVSISADQYLTCLQYKGSDVPYRTLFGEPLHVLFN